MLIVKKIAREIDGSERTVEDKTLELLPNPFFSSSSSRSFSFNGCSASINNCTMSVKRALSFIDFLFSTIFLLNLWIVSSFGLKRLKNWQLLKVLILFLQFFFAEFENIGQFLSEKLQKIYLSASFVGPRS